MRGRRKSQRLAGRARVSLRADGLARATTAGFGLASRRGARRAPHRSGAIFVGSGFGRSIFISGAALVGSGFGVSS
jgi:hypothetical protein